MSSVVSPFWCTGPGFAYNGVSGSGRCRPPCTRAVTAPQSRQGTGTDGVHTRTTICPPSSTTCSMASGTSPANTTLARRSAAHLDHHPIWTIIRTVTTGSAPKPFVVQTLRVDECLLHAALNSVRRIIMSLSDWKHSVELVNHRCGAVSPGHVMVPITRHDDIGKVAERTQSESELVGGSSKQRDRLPQRTDLALSSPTSLRGVILRRRRAHLRDGDRVWWYGAVSDGRGCVHVPEGIAGARE